MKTLWTYLDKRRWQEETKLRAALWLFSALAALVGLAAWLAVGQWAFGSVPCMLCFIGCPVVASWFAVIVYACRHSFHDGTALR